MNPVRLPARAFSAAARLIGLGVRAAAAKDGPQ